MIELIDVSKYYVTELGRHYVFQNVSLQLPFDKSIAVIGPNGAGKSTFIRLIAGADIPSEGRIIRTGRISPPMGLTPGLQSALSAGENARFAGRIYGLDRDEINDLIDHVRETADIGKFFDMPVSNYSAGMKQRVAFAINMSLDFDYYLFDEISAGGDREFRKYSKAKVQERLETSNFVIASHRSDELLDLCDAGIVIKDGELTYYDDIKDALAAYAVDDEDEDEASREKRRKRRERRERRAGREETADDTSLPAAAGGSDTPSVVPEAAEQQAEAAARREERRKRREEKRARKLADAAAAAQASTAEPAVQGATEPAVHADDGNAEAPAESREDRRARRLEEIGRRKQRILERRAEKARSSSAADADTEAIEPAPAPSAGELVEIQADQSSTQPEDPAMTDVSGQADDEDRKARRKRRERRRLRRELQAEAIHAEPDSTKPEAAEEEAVPGGEDGDHHARQVNRRGRLKARGAAGRRNRPGAARTRRNRRLDNHTGESDAESASEAVEHIAANGSDPDLSAPPTASGRESGRTSTDI